MTEVINTNVNGMLSINMQVPTTINSKKLPENPQAGVSSGHDKHPTESVKDYVRPQGEPSILVDDTEDDQQDAPNTQSEEAESQPLPSMHKVDDNMDKDKLQPESTTEVDNKRCDKLPPEGLVEQQSAFEKTPQETEEVSVDADESMPNGPPERCSVRTRQPSSALMESHQSEKVYGRKRKAEEEQDGDHPAQCMRVHFARLAVATELLIGDQEYKIAHQEREKAGI